LEKSTIRLEDNIKVDFKQIAGRTWTCLVNPELGHGVGGFEHDNAIT